MAQASSGTAISTAERLRASQNRAHNQASAAPVAVVRPSAPPPSKPNPPVTLSRVPGFRFNPDAAPAPQENALEAMRKRAAAKPAPAPFAATPAMVGAAAGMLAGLKATMAQGAASVPVPPASVETPKAPETKTTVRRSALARLREQIATAAITGDMPFPDSDNSDRGDSDRDDGRTQRAPEQPTEEVVGMLVMVKEFNEWALGTLRTADRQELRVTGESLIGLKEGLEYTFTGRTTEHAKYGEGFEVLSAAPAISANDPAIERYLVKSFDGIGPAKAHKYVQAIRREGGDEAVDKLRATLLSEPWLLDLSGMAKGAKFAEGEDPQEQAKLLMVTRNLMLRLGGTSGIREKTAKALAVFVLAESVKAYKLQFGEKAMPMDVVGDSWAALMRNPYAPIGKVEGYGFGTAETIAAVAGVPRDAPIRLSALTEYAVEQGCRRRGHTFLRDRDFVDAISKIDPSAPAQKALAFAIEEKLVVVEDGRVYTVALHNAERSLARGISRLLMPAAPLTKKPASAIEKKLRDSPEEVSEAFADGFDGHQISGISGIMTAKSRIHVLTGGPGTGKTAIMEALLTFLKNKQFAFCAPTGKAAKVLTGRVSRFGYSAVTVHSLLKGEEVGGFKVNAEEPLSAEVIVVDEGTMSGVVLADAIISAMSPTAHLIVLGDPGLPARPGVANSARAGQLPSISPGRFMQDLLLLPGINHVNLSKTYRNSGGIFEVVDEVGRGGLSTKDRAAVKFSHGLAEPAVGFPGVMQAYLDKVNADGFENTMFIIPKRQGDRETPGWNTTYANHVLRAACNPNGERLPGTTLFVGDRIILRENLDIEQPEDPGQLRGSMFDPDATGEFDFATLNSESETGKKERVVNGDTGTLIGYTMATGERRLGSAKYLRIALDDGRHLWYPGAEASSIEHAYALTVHSVQGSEYKHVMVVVTPGHPDFMNQNMLFTAFSRPKTSLEIHGDDAVIKRIASTPTPARNSALVERVAAALAEGPADSDSAEDDVSDALEERA